MRADLFLKCDCYGEGVLIAEEDLAGGVELSFWVQGMGDPTRLSFSQKLHWCWYMIRKGRPYGDMVLLKREKVQQLHDFLEELLNESSVLD
jgi:hypothetical protein